MVGIERLAAIGPLPAAVGALDYRHVAKWLSIVGSSYRRPMRCALAITIRLTALRLGQPRQGERRPRREGRRGPGPARRAPGPRRCVRAQPGARRGGPARALGGGAAGRASAADQLRDHRLRGPRTVPGQEGVRPARPVRGGAAVDHREPRGARPPRHLDRRHRGRDVRVHRHPHRAVRAGAHRRGNGPERQPPRRAGRVDGPSVLRAGLRRGRGGRAAGRAIRRSPRTVPIAAATAPRCF